MSRDFIRYKVLDFVDNEMSCLCFCNMSAAFMAFHNDEKKKEFHFVHKNELRSVGIDMSKDLIIFYFLISGTLEGIICL